MTVVAKNMSQFGLDRGRWRIDSVTEFRKLWPGSRCEVKGDRPFFADVTRWDLPRSRIEEIIATSHCSHDLAPLGGHRASNALTLDVVVDGVAIVRHGEVSVVLKTGDGLLGRAGSYRHEFPGGVHIVRVAVDPVAILSSADLEFEPFEIIPKSLVGEVLTRLVQSVLSQTSFSEEWSPTMGRPVEQALLALLQPLVSAGLERYRVNSSIGTSTRVRAESFIMNNLGNRGLTPELIAAHLGMSRRWLFHAYEGLPETLTQSIRRMRIAAVTRELETNPGLTARELAERWGFHNGDQLHRSFREQHALSIGQFRASLRDDARATVRAPLDGIGTPADEGGS